MENKELKQEKEDSRLLAELLLAKLEDEKLATLFGVYKEGEESKKLQMVLARKEKEWVNLSLKEERRFK